MQSLTHITLDMQRPNYLAVHAVQGDQLSRFVAAKLVDGGTAWSPPAGSLCTIRYIKPDGHGGMYDELENGDPAYSVSGSTVTFAFAAQTLTTPGVVLVELTFYTEDAERLSAFQFRLEVEKNPITDAEMESSDYYNILAQQIAGVLGATSHPPQIDPTTKNWLIWDENSNAYSDSGYSSVGLTGPAPVITSETRTWQASSSGTAIPTGSWSSTIPQGTPGGYIWTKDVVTYNNGDSVTIYMVSYQGEDGEGAPGNQTPLMPTAGGAVGTANAYSREDHRHPPSALHLSETINALPATISNASITEDMHVVVCSFDPSAISGALSWSIANGSVTLSGTLYAPTTIEIELEIGDGQTTSGSVRNDVCIVESGTDGIWAYHKYSDRTYHAWYVGAINLGTGTQFGTSGVYYHASLSSLVAPSFSTTVKSLHGESNGALLIVYCGHASDFKTYWLTSSAAAVSGVSVRLDMYGNW